MQIQNFSNHDILACIGIIISTGANRDNFTALEELWNPLNSHSFYSAKMYSFCRQLGLTTIITESLGYKKRTMGSSGR